MPTVNLSDEQIATIEAALKMARGSAHGMLTAVDHGNKARQTVDAIDSALAALRAPVPQPALPEWEPLIDGENDDMLRSLNPKVGVWVYGRGERMSVSTRDVEIFADLPDDIRLCRRRPQE